MPLIGALGRWPHVMKRRLVIAVGGLLLLSSVLAWLSKHSAASSDQEFSPGDFTRIREVTRQAVWGTAFPDFSLHTIKALPGRFRRLGTSHIRQIDVLPGTVRVQVQSSSGLDCYLLEKYQRSGRWDWRVVKNGIGPFGGINLNGGGTRDSELRVNGGFALIGGRRSSEPVDWLPPLAQRTGVSSEERSLPQSELSASVSNEVSLSYETHPFDPGYSPFANKPSRPGFSEGQFSAWVSNQSGPKLNH